MSKYKGTKGLCVRAYVCARARVCVYTIADHVNTERLVLCASLELNQKESYKFSCYAYFKAAGLNSRNIKYHIINVKECDKMNILVYERARLCNRRTLLTEVIIMS